MSAPATIEQIRTPVAAATAVVRAGFFDLDGFELLQRVAKAFAASTLVPKAYQGNVANCMIALNLARRLNADELMVMQNLYIVHGSPGWSSKFLIACVNTCGRYESLRYEWRGQPGAADFGCRAWTIEKSTGARLDGIWVDWKMVRAEGWDSKNGSKWLTMPDQMFIYRSAAFWQRGYAPEISMGLSSAEELADVVDVGSDGTYTVTTETLRTDMRHVDSDGVITHSPSPTLSQAGLTTGGEQREYSTAAASPSASKVIRETNAAEQQQVEAAQGGDQAKPGQEAAKQSFDIDAFAERLEKCTSQDTLDVMADEVSGMQRDRVISDDAAGTLLDIYRRRKGELQAGAGQHQASTPAAAPATSTRRRSAAASNPQQSLD